MYNVKKKKKDYTEGDLNSAPLDYEASRLTTRLPELSVYGVTAKVIFQTLNRQEM